LQHVCRFTVLQQCTVPLSFATIVIPSDPAVTDSLALLSPPAGPVPSCHRQQPSPQCRLRLIFLNIYQGNFSNDPKFSNLNSTISMQFAWLQLLITTILCHMINCKCDIILSMFDKSSASTNGQWNHAHLEATHWPASWAGQR
jgi:hypothetical protein